MRITDNFFGHTLYTWENQLKIKVRYYVDWGITTFFYNFFLQFYLWLFEFDFNQWLVSGISSKSSHVSRLTILNRLKISKQTTMMKYYTRSNIQIIFNVKHKKTSNYSLSPLYFTYNKHCHRLTYLLVTISTKNHRNTPHKIKS